ncbi:ABC transporter ATP-binding protein [Ornithinibacillus gellani]|nr:ABC transporter ATP-binding protein [Ornithinibacillus gellani]
MRFFNKKEKKRLLLLLFMMVFAALFETLGIGLIVPFIGIVTNPEMILENRGLHVVYQFLHFQSTTAFTVFAVVCLLLVFLLKNLYLMLFNYVQLRIILNQQVKLSRELFKAYLIKPYTFHLQRNSAELLRNVNQEVPNVFQGIIMSSFQLFTELLVIACIMILLLIVSPVATLTASVLLGGSVVVFFTILRKKISALGKEQQRVSGAMIQWVNQGLGASKEVKVSGKERFFIQAYTSQNQVRANNSRYMKMLELVPRLFIETLLVSIVLITMLIIVFQGTSTSELISTMALFAMAAFRLMPSITRVVALITTIRYSQPSLAVVYADLFHHDREEPINKQPTIINSRDKAYRDAIRLQHVHFRYPGQMAYAVNDISLTIPIGQSVAFIGESGAGKTTLVDTILGLFQPEKGAITIDGIDLQEQLPKWRQKIGYIPQSIFLSDDTIRGNVAFGINRDEIDDQEVWRALEQAQLKTFIKELPDQLDTEVGEQGVRLSGGQRQRIGIARALYHNPEILFMDEATSALDHETEKEIMQAIDSLKGEKTFIIIAHRLTTIENCDLVFTIHNGRLVNRKEGGAKQSVM